MRFWILDWGLRIESRSTARLQAPIQNPGVTSRWGGPISRQDRQEAKSAKERGEIALALPLWCGFYPMILSLGMARFGFPWRSWPLGDLGATIPAIQAVEMFATIERHTSKSKIR